MEIEELACQWLNARLNGDASDIEILPLQTCQGLVVWFYDAETGKDLDFFLTVPMVKELLDGKAITQVRNRYERRPQNEPNVKA